MFRKATRNVSYAGIVAPIENYQDWPCLQPSLNNNCGIIEEHRMNQIRGHIDKPMSTYTSRYIQTSYVKHSFYLGFNRGMVLEIFGAYLFE